MAILKNTANWLYELDSNALGTVGSVDVAYLEKILGKLEKCIEILVRDKLFAPSQISLSRWFLIEDARKIDLEKGIELIDIKPDSKDKPDILIMKNIASQQSVVGDALPADIKISGISQLTGDGVSQNNLDYLMSIHASFIGGGSIQICVFDDVWLPFSFDGNSQNLSYEKNASKLESALKEIESILKVEPIFDDASDLCEISGYRLRNFTDGDGNIIGIDHTGRFLEGT